MILINRYIHDYRAYVSDISSLSFMFYWQHYLHASFKNLIENGSQCIEQYKTIRIFFTISADFVTAYTPYFANDVKFL